MVETNHNDFMQRAIDLARNGSGLVAPNPMVGAVVVHNGRIIGEGWHKQYGGPHAEVNALNDVSEADQALLPESTIYVTLEPCSHHGKTPPCADLIVSKGLKQVVIANTDPNPLVAGQGIERMRDAGIEVITDVMQQSGQVLNKRFFAFHKLKRPYVTLKWAQTANGYFAPNDGTQKWITGEVSRRLVHKWRSEEASIMVGTNTALADNPKLDTRFWAEGTDPTRIVLDRNMSLPKDLNLFNGKTKTIVFTAVNGHIDIEQVVYKTVVFDDQLIVNILTELYNMNIQSVMVEGGAQLLQSFIDADLWDEANILTGPDNWDDGLTAPILNSEPIDQVTIGGDILSIYVNTR